MISGINTLIALRKSGKRPSIVYLDMLGSNPPPATIGDLATLWLTVSGNTENDDLRPLVGLETVILAPTLNASVSSLYERLTGYANEITVLLKSFGTDLGWIWLKNYGQMELDDVRWVRQFDKARSIATDCARRNDIAGHRAAMEMEMEAIARLPILKTGGAHGAVAV